MKSRARNPGLLGRLVLGGAVATLPFLSGCVSNADNLYRTGQITAQQHAQMKAAENQRDDGLVFTVLGTLMGMNGIKTGNVDRAFVGESMRNYGIAQASADNTNVVVNNNLGTNPNVPTPYIPQVEYKMPDVKIVGKTLDTPLVIQRDDGLIAVISNSCYDFDRNGIIEYPGDFSGLKSVYLPGEQITLSLVSGKNRNLEIRVGGKTVIKQDAGNISKIYSGEFPEGKHTVEFYVDNRSLGSLDFQVNSKKMEFSRR